MRKSINKNSRRNFIKNASVAAVGFYIMPGDA
ncbi:MAG: twin-arginine translocation signal domain-containing protein [Aquabacterium sp.]|nr:twin-arginine translocation signal domain-containing protein [Ferruginibacter sp.]